MVSIFIIVMPNGSDYGQGNWTQCHVAQNPFQEQESWLQTTWNILWPKSWSLHRTSWQICISLTSQESWLCAQDKVVVGARIMKNNQTGSKTQCTNHDFIYRPHSTYSSPCLLELGRLLDHQSRSQTLSVVYVHTTWTGGLLRAWEWDCRFTLVTWPDPTQLTWGEGVWCHKSKSLG